MAIIGEVKDEAIIGKFYTKSKKGASDKNLLHGSHTQSLLARVGLAT